MNQPDVRDMFAAAAMQAFVTRMNFQPLSYGGQGQQLAKASYEVAEFMMAEREEVVKKDRENPAPRPAPTKASSGGRLGGP